MSDSQPKEPPATTDQDVDNASDDSFPASDPPTYSRGQTEDPPDIDPLKFEQRRQAEERAKYGSDEHHDGR